ncbi:hypothetical protein [Bacillus sp. FJAT-50079]|uniref:ABC transporter permease n=1 Tax=Bacillus sp. FJAT-50079 TaxID=2833577 RepID=UPI001BC92EE2|nr:hypothetical protein [Bacillus sp. FJAT-50079]MBS4209315.1 hypothetical protein [Bacillus sp. FJAT-50079]
MKMIQAMIRNERLLLFRNKFISLPFVINLLCWGYLIITYEIETIHYGTRMAIFYQGFIWMLLLNLFIIGLFAVYMAGKDREFEQLAATYRVKNIEWLTGKWLITQIYGLCVTLLTMIIQVCWLASSGVSFADIIYVFVQMGGALFFIISIGFLSSIIIKNMFAYLVIPVILLLSLLMPFDYSGTALSFDNPRFHILTPFDYMFIETPYEGLWGIDRVFAGSILHQSAVLLLSVMIFLAVLLLYRPVRRLQSEKELVLSLLVIFIIPTLIFSGIRYAQYEQALKQYIKTGNLYTKSYEEDDEQEYYEWMNSYYDYYLDDQPYEFSMEKTNLTVELLTDDRLQVNSQLTMKNNGNIAVNDLFLTLYHGLQIKECASEQAISCSRDKDVITLHFDEKIEPNAEIEVSLRYEGNILQYRNDGNIEQAFIKKNRVYLPKESGWYPLVGKRPLVISREHDKQFVQFELRNGRLVEDFPTDFTVEVIAKDQKVPMALSIPEVSAGRYEGSSQYGLSLIGGNIKEITVDQIRVIGQPEMLAGAEEVVHQYEKGWNFIESWLGIQMKPSVIYILNDRHYYNIIHTINYDFFALGSGELRSIDDEEIAYALMNELTNDRPMTMYNEDFNAFYDAMLWLLTNQLREVVSFQEWYMENRWIEDDVPPQVKLLQSYEEKGEFAEVVKFLYEQYRELEDKQEFQIDAALRLYEGESNK